MIERGMRKLVPLLACLMLVMTFWTGMAHAVEVRGIETSHADLAVHGPGDGDEVPADADKGYPHHHASCHEHHVNTPVLRTASTPMPADDAEPAMASSRALGAHEPEAALRPPRP